MRQNLSRRFFFVYKGSNRMVIDAGGPKRDVFQKILPVYTKKFFEIIEDNEDYVIIKSDVDMNILRIETKQLTLLAKASETKIFLKIDPILLSLLQSNNFNRYFNNNKRNSFSKLYREFNDYFKYSNNNSELMKNFKTHEFNNEELKKKLEQEIRFRRFAITRGFINMEQFNKMTEFIREFYHIPDSFITCELMFDLQTFVKRIKIFKKVKINDFENFQPVPLERYVQLSKNTSKCNIKNNSNNIIDSYPYLIPFLNFILGPESSDDNRKLFVIYVSGSLSYTGELKILLSHISNIEAGNRPFQASTCGKYLELFIDRTHNRRNIKVEAIKQQLLSDTGFGLA